MKEHKQNGKLYPAGTRLAMSHDLANWLIAQGIAVDAGAAPMMVKPKAPVRRGCCGW